MKVGDKVRLLRGTEEGRVISIKNNIVDIEIEDGFVIPALKNEVVVVAAQEADSFDNEDESIADQQKQPATEHIEKGIYLGFSDYKQADIHGFIINQTSNPIVFSISQYDKKAIHGKAYGICKEFAAEDIGTYTTSILNEAKRLLVQILIHEDVSQLKKQPLVSEIIISKEDLANTTYLSSISQQLALINVEKSHSFTINPGELKQKMMEENVSHSSKKENLDHKKESLSVDLHVDPSKDLLEPNEILAHQLNEFEKAYDNALVMNLGKLKIIHGIGTGILRNEIHKRLSKKPEVKYFEDADKERFGFGSTIIYF